ncbi:MAG: histidine phosphatase family protein [Alphaproteobacteria bacterium]|nr:histidine phosphatase family protein [Alphaproteobacteria bacterium]
MLPDRPFYMIRHGQTEANSARIMAGHTDSPLTAKGRKQARDAQNVVKALNIKPTAIVHSHLSRAHDTAAIINEVLNISMHEETDLAELYAGDWEGQPVDICKSAFATRTNAPNGESFDEFEARIQCGINKVLKTFESPVLIVSHGGVFRAFGGIYKLSVLGTFENCHLYEFQPNLKENVFPWDVYSYNYDVEQKEVSHAKEEIYGMCERF